MIGRRGFRYCCATGGGGGGGDPVECSSCIDNLAPFQWLIELNFSSGCSGCSSFNGSYLVEHQSGCTWFTCFDGVGPGTSGFCGLTSNSIGIEVVVGYGLVGFSFQIFVRCRLTYGSSCGNAGLGIDTFRWLPGLTTNGTLDCLNVDAESMTWVSSSGTTSPPWCGGSVLLSAA